MQRTGTRTLRRMPGVPLGRGGSASGRQATVARRGIHADPHRPGARTVCRARIDRAWSWLQGRDRRAGRSDESTLQPMRCSRPSRSRRRARWCCSSPANPRGYFPRCAAVARDCGLQVRRERTRPPTSRRRAAQVRGRRRWPPPGQGRSRCSTPIRRGWRKLRTDTITTLRDIGSGNLQPPAVAEHWAKNDLAIRLSCLESWVTDRILESASIRDVTHLSEAALAPKICRLFEFSDAIRDMRKLAHTSINKTMAVEALLWRWARQ